MKKYLQKSTGTKKKTSFSSQLTSKQLKDQRSHQTEKSSNEGSQTFLDLMSSPKTQATPVESKVNKKNTMCDVFLSRHDCLKPPSNYILEVVDGVAMDRWHIPRQSLGICLIRLFFFVIHSSNVYHGFGRAQKFHPHTTWNVTFRPTCKTSPRLALTPGTAQ